MNGEGLHNPFTSSEEQALSSDIEYYNTFVQEVANAAGIGIGSEFFGDLSWKAVISTEDTDAYLNAHNPFLVNVYNMGDEVVSEWIWEEVAAEWKGGLYKWHNNAVRYDEHGELRDSSVWTGTDSFGYAANGEAGSWIVEAGLSFSSTHDWIEAGAILNEGEYLPLYALSGVITVTDVTPEPIPEPATIFLFGSGCVGLAGMMRRKKKQH